MMKNIYQTKFQIKKEKLTKYKFISKIDTKIICILFFLRKILI